MTLIEDQATRRLARDVGARAAGSTGRPRWIDLGANLVPMHRDRAIVDVPELGTLVLLVRTRKGVVAMESRCPHRGLSLEDARVSMGKVTCPGHSLRFRIDTGDCAGPWRGRLRTWPATVVRGRVFVQISE